MPEALAATVAGRGGAVLAGPGEVVEVVAELALVDHARRLAGRALVVDRVGAPLAGHRAVVIGRQQRAGEALAQASRIDRGMLLHRVGFEAVTRGLVKEDATEAVAHHDRHAARRRRLRREHRQRPARGLVRDRCGVALEQLEAGMAGERLRAGLDAVTAPRHRLRSESHPRAVVAADQPFGVGELDLAAQLVVARGHLHDLGGRGPRPLVALDQHLGLALGGHVLRTDLDGLGRRVGDRLQRLRAGLVPPHRRGDLRCHPFEVRLGEPVHVAEVGRVAGDDADARSQLHAGLGRLHLAVVEGDGEARAAFRIQLGEVAAA